MSLLFRYQLRGLLLRLAFTWPGLCLVYLAFELGDQGRRLAASAGWAKVLVASLLHLPLVSVQMLPAALLLAAVLLLHRLREAGELEAMAVAGALPRQRLWPLLAAGLLAAGGAALLGELAAPRCEREADRRLGTERVSPITGEGPPSGWLTRGSPQARTFLQLTPVGRGRAAMIGLELDAGYRVRRQLAGEVDAVPVGQDELRARPEALSTGALARRVAELRASGRGRPAEELLLQARFAFPCLNLLCALIAWTQAFRSRGRSLLLALLEGLLWLLGLFVLLALGWLAARAGWLSPRAGAWAPLGLGLLLAGTVAGHRLRQA